MQVEEDFEKHKLDIDQNLEEEEEEEENPEEKIKTHWNPLLLTSCEQNISILIHYTSGNSFLALKGLKSAIKGDLQTLKKCLDKKANIFYEEKKWNSLVWACSKGSIEIVRYLLEKGAGQAYLPRDKRQPDQQDSNDKDKRTGQGTINSNARPTPLQWACFKGHVQVVWVLLKEGLDLLETDSFGNNAIHQAVASGNVEIVETLLQYGVRVDYKNNRGHTVFDLCTEPKIQKYLKEYENATHCAGTNKPFVAGDVKYLCIITGRYYSADACQLYWIYASKNSVEAEKFERRSNKAMEEVLKIEGELKALLGSYDYQKLCEKLQFIDERSIHVDVKLLHKAHIHQEKLKTQIEINTFIASLSEVDNYKTIKKSINVINEMIEDAKTRNVELDLDILAKAQKECERLEAERNLRFVLDNPGVEKSSSDEVARVEELKRIAVEKGVADKYCDEQEELLTKMRKNIEANTIINNFCSYPQRDWYPPPYYLDPKTKKPMDSATRKPIDPALLKPPPVKKKGKKAPKYVIPDWATDTAELGRCIKRLEELLLEVADINISEESLKRSTEELERMKKEWKYRRQLDEEAKLEAEKNAKKKK